VTQSKNGTTVFLIHGWGLGSGVWETFSECLPIGWQVQTIDLPGYGLPLRGACVSSDIDAIADQLMAQVPAGAILIGWSLGGMVAIKLAERLGNKIRGLMLLASTPCFVKKPDWPHGIEVGLLRNMASNLGSNRDKILQSFIMEIGLGDPSPRNTIRFLQGISTNNTLSLDILSSGLEILGRVDLRTNISSLACPVGMVLGKNDHLIAYSTGQATQSLCPQTQLFIIEKAGHVPFISQQEKTAQAINAFIGELQ